MWLLGFGVVGCRMPTLLERSSFELTQSSGAIVVAPREASKGLALKRNSQTYYVFDAQLVGREKAKYLSYHGTEQGYHLFCIYQKYTTDPKLVYHIAFRETDCTVENPRPRFDEFKANGASYRVARFDGDRCTVRARKNSSP